MLVKSSIISQSGYSKVNRGSRLRIGSIRPRTNQKHPNTAQKEDAMTPNSATKPRDDPTADKNAIRPFQVDVPEAELTELRRRINATKWPDRETVTDASQGVQLATTQKLAWYWATEYDWRKIEAKMNALP